MAGTANRRTTMSKPAPETCARLVKGLEQRGWQPPDEVKRLQEAIAAIPDAEAMEQDATTRLTEAVAAGDSEAIAAATRELALARAASPDGVRAVDDARQVAQEQVDRALTSAAVTDGWAFLVTAFNKTAAELEQALAVVDSDVAPMSIIAEPAKVRQAWRDTPAIVSELDKLKDLLADCVEVAGRRFKRPEPLFWAGLVLEADDQAKRAVVAAWTPARLPAGPGGQDGGLAPEGRAGRWGRVMAAGGALKVTAERAQDFRPWTLPDVVRVGQRVLDPLDGADAQEIERLNAVREKNTVIAGHGPSIFDDPGVGAELERLTRGEDDQTEEAAEVGEEASGLVGAIDQAIPAREGEA
jgi:hypothetical protein